MQKGRFRDQLLLILEKVDCPIVRRAVDGGWLIAITFFHSERPIGL